MRWDGARPVPWKKLLVPFAIYAGIATIFLSLFGKTNLAGILLGVAMGGSVYLGVAVVMVKLGWNPPAWGGARGAGGRGRGAEAADTKSGTPSKPTTPDGPRAKPKATSRTNAGNYRAKRGR
jgi:hypothetical protein